MRAPHALFTVFVLSACGEDQEGGSTGSASQASQASAATGTETSNASTPTSGDPQTTAVATESAGTDTTTTPTGGESSGVASTGGTSTGGSTGAASASASDASSSGESSGESSGAGESSTGPGCPEGQDGCPCGPGDSCDGNLVCLQGVCGPGPMCGNGKLDMGEACDDGANNGDDKACKADCTKQVCGDGKLGPGEVCDDGANNGDNKACKLDCTKQVCGDGKVGPGELCDDGANNGDNKACKLDCSKQVCGDGKLGPGEMCDDGANNGDNKACKLDCSKQVCGDGKLGPGEVCDDGNQINGDGCEKTCVKTPMQAKDACGYASDDGVWFQIDYSNANTVTSPAYSYSATPGWGEPEWAPTGKSWPYTVDLFNNASVINDQIGKVALLNGTNKAVRVYFGLAGLTYDYATVCVEGRSYSVGSSVTFFVMEAKTKVGDYGMMANDWTVHATGIDMQHFFINNDEFQAVQVQPSSGSGALSLKRLRVTLHGANY